jgi:N-acetylglucosamine-6-sulfatase
MVRRLPLGTLAALACALVGAALPAGVSAQVAPRPNIVFVLTDDQRWDTLGAMPTVQRELVARGVTFTNAFAVNPLCCPSRASFLTGRYSHSTGVYDNNAPHGGAAWFDDSSTLATWLSDAGYRTAYVGKYLNRYPNSGVPLGWHHWLGFNGGYYGYWLSVHGLRTFFGSDAASYSTDMLTREAVSFVQTTADPFFLVYAPYAPHGPATPAPRHEDAFEDVARWRPASYDEEDVADKPAWLRSRPQLTEDERRSLDDFRRRQLASLRAVDEGVGELVAALRDSGRLADTIIVFASDNGLLWGEHRQANRKTSAYEESIRIPFVVRYDAHVAGGRREARLVTNVDLAPTLAELAGTAAPGAEGASLVPLLAPSLAPVAAPWRGRFLVEHMQGRLGATAEVPTYCAVRGGRYKYVLYATREEELYDLAADPLELENRAGDPAFRARLSSLRTDLKELCAPPPPGFDLDWLCTLEAEGGSAVLTGTLRADTICGSRGAEAIRARAGDDVVRAGGGRDDVRGDAGADRLHGGPGRDRIAGGPGDDVLHARDGMRDLVVCGTGRDVVHADRGDTAARNCESVVRPRPPKRPPRA